MICFRRCFQMHLHEQRCLIFVKIFTEMGSEGLDEDQAAYYDANLCHQAMALAIFFYVGLECISLFRITSASSTQVKPGPAL